MVLGSAEPEATDNCTEKKNKKKLYWLPPTVSPLAPINRMPTVLTSFRRPLVVAGQWLMVLKKWQIAGLISWPFVTSEYLSCGQQLTWPMLGSNSVMEYWEANSRDPVSVRTDRHCGEPAPCSSQLLRLLRSLRFLISLWEHKNDPDWKKGKEKNEFSEPNHWAKVNQ